MQNNEHIDIIIDEEFKRILPALDDTTLAWLEENILEYGCREPIVLWNGILIDGHHRYSILTKHKLPVNTVSMEFNSRDEVLIWIISTQVSRRNLNPMQLSYFRGLHYNADKRIVGNTTGRNQHKLECGQNDHIPKPQPTAGRLADHYNVSSKTIRRDAQVASAISKIGETSPETKTDILSGKTQITRKQLQELSSGTKDDVETIVEQITTGNFESRGAQRSSAGTSTDHTNSPEVQLWEKQFIKMTDEFRQSMRNHAKINDTNSIKTTIRQYINMLEELYWNM